MNKFAEKHGKIQYVICGMMNTEKSIGIITAMKCEAERLVETVYQQSEILSDIIRV